MEPVWRASASNRSSSQRNATYKTKARPSVIEDKVSNVVDGDIAGPLKKALGPLFAFINFVRGEDYPAFRTN